MKTIVGITDNLTFNQLSKLDSFIILYNHISHSLYVDLFIKKGYSDFVVVFHIIKFSSLKRKIITHCFY